MRVDQKQTEIGLRLLNLPNEEEIIRSRALGAYKRREIS